MADAIADAHEGERREDDGLHRLRRRLRRRLARRDAATRRRPPASRSSPRRNTTAPTPSVTGQVLKLVAANPDAILIAAAGTPGATPQKELVARNYKGKIYQTHGVANPDFLRVVGKDGNGTMLPIGPMLVYEQLPDSNPLKKSAAEYITQVRGEVRPGLALDVRRPCLGRLRAAREGDSRGAEEGDSRAPRNSGRAARRARERRRRSSRRTASTR